MRNEMREKRFVNDDLAHAIRLLHVIRAWSYTPGNESNPARRDILYPLNNGRQELYKEMDILLKRYPYQKPLSTGAPNELVV